MVGSQPSVRRFKNIQWSLLGVTAMPCYRGELCVLRRRESALQEQQLRNPETASGACEGNAQPRPYEAAGLVV
ncbi:UNVERIFIED_CONTAM: hypothetical protein FKN15_044966 [Acipenser sinensis]